MSNEPTIPFESFNYQANIFSTSIGLVANEKADGQPTGKAWMHILFFIAITNMNWVMLGELGFIILGLANGNNFVESTMLIAFFSSGVVGDIKIFRLWRQQEHISEMMRNLRALYPQTSFDQRRYNVRSELKRYNRLGFAYAMVHEILIWGYNIFPILSYIVYELLLQVSKVGIMLPYNCWLPFDWHGNWRFYPMYLSQIAAGQVCFSGQLANDLLLTTVAVQLIMHYRQLAKRIESYVAGRGNVRRAEKHEQSEEDLRFIRGVIVYHQKILNLSQALNDVFGISLFINFALASLIICFVLFQITIGAAIDSIIMLTFFFCCTLVQIFFICYFAQGLLEASESISLAVYNHNWYDADLGYKKMLIFIMQRAQKPTKLEATSFVSVSMSTMTELLQISYKGFAVVRTMYAREAKHI